MTCAEMDERLDAWVDGALPEAEGREVEAHLAGCAACREEERRLREILVHAAALPRSVTPARDLWPGIAREIERGRSWAWPGLAAWQPMLAVAAAVVVTLTAVFFGTQAPAPVHTVAIPGPAADAGYRLQPAAVITDPGLAAMEEDYQDAANALLAALQERRGEIEPETLATVESNLAVIDEALANIHRALEKDPDRPELGRMLVSTHQKRVDVLRKMVRLSTTL
jgi:hypothetical protein